MSYASSRESSVNPSPFSSAGVSVESFSSVGSLCSVDATATFPKTDTGVKKPLEIPGEVIMLFLQHVQASLYDPIPTTTTNGPIATNPTGNSASAGSSAFTSYRGLKSWPFPATHVSALWRAVALAMPELYTQFWVHPAVRELAHPARMARFLELGQGRGLHAWVVGEESGSGRGYEDEEMDEESETESGDEKTLRIIRDPVFLSSVPRWTDAHVVLKPDLVQLLFLWAEQFPALRSLYLAATGTAGILEDEHLLDAALFPALTRLTLAAHEGAVAGQLLFDINAPLLTSLSVRLNGHGDEGSLVVLGDALLSGNGLVGEDDNTNTTANNANGVPLPIESPPCLGSQLTSLSILRGGTSIEACLVDCVLKQTPNLVELTLGTTARLPCLYCGAHSGSPRACTCEELGFGPRQSIDEELFLWLVPAPMEPTLALPRLEKLRLEMHGHWELAQLPLFLATRRLSFPETKRGEWGYWVHGRVNARRLGCDVLAQGWGVGWEGMEAPLKGGAATLKSLELFVTHETSNYGPEMELIREAVLGSDFQMQFVVIDEPEEDSEDDEMGSTEEFGQMDMVTQEDSGEGMNVDFFG